MKTFEEMTPQRKAAHELFDKVLDMRVLMMRRMLVDPTRASIVGKSLAVIEEHEETLAGAQELVVISELIAEAVEQAKSAMAMDANQPPKLGLVGSNPAADTEKDDAPSGE